MILRLFSLIIICAPLIVSAQEFPYPDVPDSLQTPESRMEFLLDNYWSRFDFNDTTATNCQVGEQGFSDFIYALGYADAKQRERSAADFVGRAFATEWGATHYDHLMEHYLFNPNSPLRNDLVYASLLREVVAHCTVCSDVIQDNSRFRLEQVSKNQPGTVASDFAYITRNGEAGRMRNLNADFLLLVFHDPDCENCERILPQLMREPVLQNQSVKVLAVYPDFNTEEWRRKSYNMPANWIDTYSPKGEISKKSIYFIQATPSLYLLDSAKNVILKDATPQFVLQNLSELLKNK